MNEISQILEHNEKLIYDSKPEFVPYFISVLFGNIVLTFIISFVLGSWLKSVLLGFIAGVVLFILGLSLSILAYQRTHYAITNKRVILQSGIIGRDFKSIDYDHMKNVSLTVGLLGILFKVGTVKIFTGELTGGKRIRPKYDTLVYIASPHDVLKQIQTHLSVRKEELA